MTDPDVMALRPYWRYVHCTLKNPRIDHQSWHGTVLEANHPWFLTHYPPNGFGCKCLVETLSRRDLKHLGKDAPDPVPDDGTYDYIVPSTGQTVRLPKGIQYGWDYTPGKSAAETALAAWQNRLESFNDAVARANVAALVESPVFTRFFAGQLGDEFPIAVIQATDRAALGAASSVVLLSRDSLADHLHKHPGVALADYRLVQRMIDGGEVYKDGDRHLVYFWLNGKRYRAVLKRTQDTRKNYFLSLYRDSGNIPPGLVRVR